MDQTVHIPAPYFDPDALRDGVLGHLSLVLEEGRERVREAFLMRPRAGLRCARSLAYVMDCVVSGAMHYVSEHVHPIGVRTKGEHLAVVGVSTGAHAHPPPGAQDAQEA